MNANTITAHEVLVAVFQVRPSPGHPETPSPGHPETPSPGHPETPSPGHSRTGPDAATPELCVLLWQRALPPMPGAWSLPGGTLRDDEDLPTSARRQLAEKVDVQELAHLEQLSVFSDPCRVPGRRVIASTFLGLIPCQSEPELPPDTSWHPVARLPGMAFDHRIVVDHARSRLAAKLSYTNIGFALAPGEFTISTLRTIYSAALGYPVDATNLQRVLGRRGVITPTGTTARSGRTGGRPAALYRYADTDFRVTDEFAALRPPS